MTDTAPAMTPEQEPRQGSAERNWPEDAAHENGNYLCKCAWCSQDFVGHKRRTLCRKCENTARGKTVVERLREACNGHPSAAIPWPHRILHDAADKIEEQQATLSKLEAGTHVLVPVGPTEAMTWAGREARKSVRSGGVGGQTMEETYRHYNRFELATYHAMITAAQEGE